MRYPDDVLGFENFIAVGRLRHTHRVIISSIIATTLCIGSGIFCTAHATINGTDLALDPLGNAVGFIALVESETKESSQTLRCTGVAIAPDIVLTAGHCVRNVNELRVKFVSNISPLDFETILVRKYRMHPMTNGGFDGKMYDEFREDNSRQFHDIAVLLLEAPSNFASPVPIAPPDFRPEAGDYTDKFYHFGRGRDQNFRYKGNIEFNEVTWPRPIAGGDNYYKADLGKNAEGELQAACGGDSGGPVTVGKEDDRNHGHDIHYLVGVMALYNNFTSPKDIGKAKAAWGKAESIPRCGKLIGFVNIQAELQWIREAIDGMDPSTNRKLRVFGE